MDFRGIVKTLWMTYNYVLLTANTVQVLLLFSSKRELKGN